MNHADERLLKLVNALITEYEDTLEEEYDLTINDKKEIDSRMKLFKEGKMKIHTVEEVRKKIMKQLGK